MVCKLAEGEQVQLQVGLCSQGSVQPGVRAGGSLAAAFAANPAIIRMSHIEGLAASPP